MRHREQNVKARNGDARYFQWKLDVAVYIAMAFIRSLSLTGKEQRSMVRALENAAETAFNWIGQSMRRYSY